MLKILHVGINSFFKKILNDSCTEKGIIYYEAKNIDTAADIVEENEIDLVLTEYELSNESAKDLINRFKDYGFRNLPVALISSNNSIELKKEMYELGVVDYIPKEISLEKLNRYLEKLVQESRLKDNLRNLSIAVLDDSRLELSIIKNIFRLNKIDDVDYFETPEEILESEKHYDIYLLDIVMPNISGEELIIEIRKTNSESVIVAISSIENYKTISDIFLYGADDYIMKPFDAVIFMARLMANARNYINIKELKNREGV